MKEQNIENDYFFEQDRLLEERNLNVHLGIAFLVVWILSIFILVSQNY